MSRHTNDDENQQQHNNDDDDDDEKKHLDSNRPRGLQGRATLKTALSAILSMRFVREGPRLGRTKMIHRCVCHPPLPHSHRQRVTSPSPDNNYSCHHLFRPPSTFIEVKRDADATKNPVGHGERGVPFIRSVKQGR
ncbi:hypothetical protein K0M31_003077 [Melipona bicolor]|uniref:Uncharacterized protein n=1 Tax=Melipona bicolor TaxID=60889 RepID=A0AA40G105_9HYME|nr:hypothetical protein K0M31_003077 [Melipona bicolor]